MTAEDLLVLKLGGSLITDKSTPYKLRDNVLENVVAEIKECFNLGLIKRLVLVHGVGSFGHPPVLEYNLHKGFRDKAQLISMSKTQQIVNNLRIAIATKFIEIGIPINLMHASSVFIGKDMVIKHNPFESLKGFLSLGMVPLIGGDMMYDVWGIANPGPPSQTLVSGTRNQKSAGTTDAELDRACRDFESVFIHYMLQQMRRTVPRDPDDGLDGGGAQRLRHLRLCRRPRSVGRQLPLCMAVYRRHAGRCRRLAARVFVAVLADVAPAEDLPRQSRRTGTGRDDATDRPLRFGPKPIFSELSVN